MNTTPRYEPDEFLIWNNFEGGSVTKRQVAFRSQKGNRATVAFGRTAEGGERLYDIPLSHLSRPEPVHNRAPIYHDRPITAAKAPTPPSDEALNQRLATRKAELQTAHITAQRQREVVASCAALVQRAQGEFEASRAALLEIAAKEKDAERRIERALRAGETPPEIEPIEDRAVIVRRVEACQTALSKFTSEHQQAERRLGEAVGGVIRAATGVITVLFEMDCEKLRVAELEVMEFRANLLRISQWWPNGKTLPISEAAASVLVNLFDTDKLKFMGNPAASVPWEELLARLIRDPEAGPVTEAEAQAAE